MSGNMGAMNTEHLIAQLEASRAWFLKLVDGLTPEQWDAKPYPNVMSPKETVAHLIIDDKVFPVMFEGKEPDYAAYAPDASLSAEQLLEELARTHESKIQWLRSFLEGKDLNSEIETVYFGKQPMWVEIMACVTEDWYHIGQVSAIRQGTDPNWEYYAAFY